MTVAEGIRTALRRPGRERARRIFDFGDEPTRWDLHDAFPGRYQPRTVDALRSTWPDAAATSDGTGRLWPGGCASPSAAVFGERLRVQRPRWPAAGETADWWTIERLDPDELVLGSTSWFFGDAWLAYLVEGRAEIVQVASFRPKGVPGVLYWRLLRPIHGRVFHAMLRHRLRRARDRRSVGPGSHLRPSSRPRRRHRRPLW